ncbi:MAG: 4Fe-4S dicluster domain-containing protein [Rhodobacterales bacterium]|nr:4Fe-4S dicluster domain-containing protein [Rhodobacterales bacterium]
MTSLSDLRAATAGGDSLPRWGMIADLRRCVGCQTCTAACKHTNATPPGVQWRRVLDVETGDFPHVTRTFVPIGCQHCEDPPCMHVCPSTATGQRADGIVTIDYDICIGCAYCAVACPYQARYKIDKPLFAYGRNRRMNNEAQREMPERIGVAQKCTFCSDRVDAGLEKGLTPGVDPEATPACVNSCIATALSFGDLNDANSNVSVLLRENKSFRMHQEVGTHPGFHYIWEAGHDEGTAQEMLDTGYEPSEARDEPLRPIVGGVEPWLQRHWDWRAAMNFICGGTGAGLMIAGGFLGTMGGVPQTLVTLAAVGFVCLGLFMVFLETGRPLRAPINVFFHAATSWMTREAMVGALLVPLGLLCFLTGWGWLSLPAALLAAGYLYCQGRILEQAKGIPAWREKRIVPLIAATGLTEGLGLFTAAGALFFPGDAVLAGAIVMVLAAVARAVAWSAYLRALRRGAPTLTLRVLNGHAYVLLIGGLIVPLALVTIGVMVPAFTAWVLLAGGLAAAAAGWILKFVIVTKASYNQGFALVRTPERGTGTGGGAGVGIKPGWS